MWLSRLTAVATAALAVLAAATVILAGLALRKQSKEVSAFQEQLKVQREDSDATRSGSLREQASRVSLWVERRPAGEEPPGSFARSRVVITATIRNASDLPVFVVEIAACHPNGQLHELWGHPEQLDVLMAYGTRRFTCTVDIPDEYAGIDFFFGDPVLAAGFRDNVGKRWTADSEGNLTVAPSEAVRARAHHPGRPHGAGLAAAIWPVGFPDAGESCFYRA